MKNIILILAALLSVTTEVSAQLYSSGNNTISGTNIGIGISSPLAPLHIRNTTTVPTELRLQHTNTSAGAARLSFFNDNSTAFTATANYAVLNKYAANTTGSLSLNLSNAKLFSLNNTQGDLSITTGGNVGLGHFNQANSTADIKLLLHRASGKVVIGNNVTPAAHLHISSSTTSDTVKITNSAMGNSFGDGLNIATNGLNASIINNENGFLNFGTNNISRLSINSSGLVTIGNVTTNNNYKLFVETGILTEKVKVAVKTSSEWSDYVFAPEYELPSIKAVEEFVIEKKHLPNVPSAEHMVANGLDVAKMDAKLLEKIEELTLYIIQLNKRIEKLESENLVLKSKE